MIAYEAAQAREIPCRHLTCDLAVVGGGMAGVCAAISAARAGLRVVLMQDRPVLGGNASSEVRLWILGATSHMGNNNRWAREGGVIDEILVENLWRNPEGNPVLVDALLLEFVSREEKITLLLNTAVCEVEKDRDDHIASVTAFSSLSQLRYRVTAPCFCDASGDGIVGFLAGASFRMGSESRHEFGESAAPEVANGDMLGDSLYFYGRDTGKPVKYVPPAFALTDISSILRHRELRVSDYGCRLWWLEYGGKLDTVHDSEEIRWELWRLAYAVWNHIKNSGQYPESENLTLEWMGSIPGKRESRRFEGLTMLTQQDIVEQRVHWDAVSFGGWAIDLHPPDGVYSSSPGCEQWHSKGVYQIPLSTMVSRDISNLFLAGRIISATHIAFGSTRVMATCGHNAQAAGEAAALCRELQLQPLEAARSRLFVAKLQQRLIQKGQWIPGVRAQDEHDLAASAQVTASSSLALRELPAGGEFLSLEVARALVVPLAEGPVPRFIFRAESPCSTQVTAELWSSRKPGNYIPEVLHSQRTVALEPNASREMIFDFDADWPHADYAFVVLRENRCARVARTHQRVTGILSVSRKHNKAVAKTSVQSPPPGSGFDAMEFWLPSRRPDDELLAVAIDPPLRFEAADVVNGYSRPYRGGNAWVAAGSDAHPWLRLDWPESQTIARIVLSFDTDWDHPMESVLMNHPENETPCCVKRYRVKNDRGEVLREIEENHQTRNQLVFDPPLRTQSVTIEIDETAGGLAAIFGISCFATQENAQGATLADREHA